MYTSNSNSLAIANYTAMPLLKMGVANESFYLSEKIHVANDLLKCMQIDNPNAQGQFFRISGGTSS
jgi:hypothetical protein